MDGTFNIQANAANIKDGTNPPYVLEDFYKIFPQFKDLAILSDDIVNMYIAFASACVNVDRWKRAWTLGMSNFVAHFCTLYLQSATGQSPSANEVIAASQARGLMTSKGVGDVNVSYDFSSAINGLDGWANWTTTAYGIQFATMAKMVGKGAMWVF